MARVLIPYHGHDIAPSVSPLSSSLHRLTMYGDQLGVVDRGTGSQSTTKGTIGLATSTQATAPSVNTSSSATGDSDPNVKKKVRNSKQVKSMTKGMQKNMEWPWIESLGMTEYESKEQRYVVHAGEASVSSEYMS